MRWTGVVAVAGCVVASGCTEPKVIPTFDVKFQNAATWSYGGPSCVGTNNSLYCGAWNDDSYSFGGTLTGEPLSTLSVSGTNYSRSQSDQNIFTVGSTSCHSYRIVVTGGSTADGALGGTFQEQTDCHGAGRRGTFTAMRVDVPG